MSKRTRLKNADINKVDLVLAGAQQLSSISIMKSKEDKSMSKVNKELSDDKLDKLEELLTALAVVLGAEDETTEKEDTAVTENEAGGKEKELEQNKEPENTGVEKGDPEMLKKMADIEKANKELILKIAEMENEKLEKEFISKADTLKSIPGATTEELAEVLKSVSLSNPEQYKVLENILKSANAVIENGGMFQAQGSDFEDNGDDPDAIYEKLEKMAAERVAKGSKASNSMREVINTPEGARLYAMYKSAKGGRR